MSVIYENKYGWIVDHRQLVTEVFKDVLTSYTYKEELFNINNPFMMDSQFNALCKREEYCSNPTTEKLQRKKRKRKTELNEGEENAKELHQHIIGIVLPAYKSLLDDVKDQDFFKVSKKLQDNNVAARNLSISLGPGDTLPDLCNTSIRNIETETLILKSGNVYKDISNLLVCNKENSPVKISIMDNVYLIPSRSSFIMADVKNFNSFTSLLGCMEFDFILLDPPWENKSVKRKKQYWTLSNDELFRIPVPELSASNCIVGVWVTNRVKHRNFVIEELFPYWKVSYVTTWFWLKVTKSGKMVYNIDSDHKKPYEMLILGEYKSSIKLDHYDQIRCDGYSSDTTSPQSEHKKALPLDQTVISVPSSIHSMKVPIQEIITPHLPSNPKCLEVFARNLQPGWVSFGNEVYKHQHIDYFEET